MTRSLDNNLPGDEMQGADLYINKYRCSSTSRYS